MKNHYTIIGAGLAGALLAILLRQRGFSVDVFEKRDDPRRQGYQGGRSINLALAERGLNALRAAGLEAKVLDIAIPMRGREVHDRAGASNFQPYGLHPNEYIHSIHRGRLNELLIGAAEHAGARVFFDHALESVDFAQKQACFRHAGGEVKQGFTQLIGADGAGSRLRELMEQQAPLGITLEPLGHSYKEFHIEPDSQGRHRLTVEALHIWPRESWMMIALPNVDGSFTATLFLPNERAADQPALSSFAELQSKAHVAEFFARDFQSLCTVIPDHIDQFFANPTSYLGTVRLARWHQPGALLIGDAAHAIVPFHGQGMNCAFEDTQALADLADSDASLLGEQFQSLRKPNADAIADMAVENYIEMRDLVADPEFLAMKALERAFALRYPERFVPRYSLVSFTTTPYREAQLRGARQLEILKRCRNLGYSASSCDWARVDEFVDSL